MKQLGPGVLLAGTLALGACGRVNTAGAPAGLAASQKAEADSLTQDFKTWYNYAYYQVPLGRPFVGLDTGARPLARQAFLKQLRTGRFIALRRRLPALTLQLYPLASSKTDIATTSKQLADIELDHYQQEGKTLPAFDFRDLNGRHYTPATTRGKVLVLKTWFINCTACVKEFPEVNALADRYRANPDVVFVSLALDNAAYLEAFLTNQQLNYAVVPNSEAYIADSLHLGAYPTHLVVGRDGKIVKIADKLPDLILALASVVPPPAATPPGR